MLNRHEFLHVLAQALAFAVSSHQIKTSAAETLNILTEFSHLPSVLYSQCKPTPWIMLNGALGPPPSKSYNGNIIAELDAFAALTLEMLTNSNIFVN